MRQHKREHYLIITGTQYEIFALRLKPDRELCYVMKKVILMVISKSVPKLSMIRVTRIISYGFCFCLNFICFFPPGPYVYTGDGGPRCPEP